MNTGTEKKPRFCIAIHGGAGTIRRSEMSPEKKAVVENDLLESIRAGIQILEKSGKAIDACVAAVSVLEDSPHFNAGKGSVFNSDGFIEMDAQVMCGNSLRAGAVTCIRNIKNPIKLARAILEEGRHVLLSGPGAEKEAKRLGLDFESDPYFFTQFRYDQLQNALNKKTIELDHSDTGDGRFGTVGAVALDEFGDLAASTSTGGMTNQKPGRVGDTPLVGCGNYANNKTCAVSCTGIGESFVRAVSAYDVSAMMEYGKMPLEEACNKVIREKLPAVDGEGGLIAADHLGNLSLPFISKGMYRAWCKAGEDIQLKIYRN